MNGWFTRTEASLKWMVESWIPSPIDIYERFRYIRTIPSTWMLDSHELMAESWIASLSDLNHLTLELLVFSSMDYCYGANSCFDRSKNQFLHSLFKEHEPWNRNFPTNNIELKSPPARPLGLNLFDNIFPECFVRFQEGEQPRYKARIQPRNGMDSLSYSLVFSFNEPCHFMTVLFLFTSDSVPSDSK